jgi:zinc protease
MQRYTNAARSCGQRWAAALSVLLSLAVGACKAEAPGAEQSPPGTVASPPAALAASGLPLPFDPTVRESKLPNGVTLLLRPVSANLKHVALGLVVRIGSLVERDDERGLAHFVEHMAFAGTEHFPKRALVEFLESVGLTFGADANAHTTYDSTSYLLELPADDPEVLDRAVLVLRDWAGGIAFDAAAVDAERPVVLAEKRLRDNAKSRLQQRLNDHWFSRGSRHAERGPIGTEAVIGSASAEQLRSFYRRWYQPQNLAIVASGDFDVGALRRRIEEQFGNLPSLAEPVAPPQYVVPVAAGDRFVVETDPELPVSLVSVTLQRQARPVTSEADYRRSLVDALLSNMLRRRVRALPSNAGSGLLDAMAAHEAGPAGTFDVLRLSGDSNGREEQALTALLTELERVRQHGFRARELEAARSSLGRRWEAQWKQRQGLMAEVEQLGRHFVVGEAVPGALPERALVQRLLSSITLDEINQSSRSWLDGSARYVIAAGRDAAKIPGEAALRQLAERARAEAVGPYEEGPDVALVSAEPEPGKIVLEQMLAPIAAQVWTLSNGARVVFKRMAQEERGKISFRGCSAGGTARQRDADVVVSRFATDIVPRLGLGANDAASTQRLLAEENVQISPWITDYLEGVDGSAPSENIESLFQALYSTLAAPGRDAAAFELSRRRVRQVLQRRLDDPAAYFAGEVASRSWRGQSRHAPLAPDAADRLDLSSVLAFYKDRFGDVGDFTFVFVGDTTEDAIRPLVERYLASVPGSQRQDAVSEADLHYPSGITRVRVRRGSGSSGKVSLIFHGSEPLPASGPQDLDALSGYLGIRLREVLRERMSGVYALQARFQIASPPEQGYSVAVDFDCKPDQCEALKRAALGVVAELAGSAPDRHYVETLERQRVAWVTGALKSGDFWRNELVEAYLRGRDPLTIPARARATDSTSSEALRRSAKRYLRLDQYVDAELLPETSR